MIPQIEDFLDLAAAIAACDLVVSVDTAVPHLAAAGGVPVLLLSRPDACWRWGVAGDSPWYEAVEVLRHGGDMDWPGVLAEAALRIGRLAVADAGERRFVTVFEERSVADGPWRVADHLRILAFGPSADEAARAAAAAAAVGRSGRHRGFGAWRPFRQKGCATSG